MSRLFATWLSVAVLGGRRPIREAIARFNETKERAYMAVMKTDLRALADSLAGYHAKHGRYVAGTASNAAGKVTSSFPADFRFAPNYNVTVRVDTSAGAW